MMKPLCLLTAVVAILALASCSTVNEVGEGVLDTTGAVVNSTGPVVSGVANTAGTAVTGAGRTVQDAASAPVY